MLSTIFLSRGVFWLWSPPYNTQMSINFGMSKIKFSYRISPKTAGVMKSSWKPDQFNISVIMNYCMPGSAYITQKIKLYSMQNHGSDVYSVCKKWDSVSSCLKLHEPNDHRRHTSIVKGKHASLASNTSVFCWIVWWWWRCSWDAPFVSLFCWYKFPNCVCKCIVHLHTVHRGGGGGGGGGGKWMNKVIQNPVSHIVVDQDCYLTKALDPSYLWALHSYSTGS